MNHFWMEVFHKDGHLKMTAYVNRFSEARLERPPLFIEILKNGHIKKQTDGLGQEMVRC
jgi:hypothetical protein